MKNHKINLMISVSIGDLRRIASAFPAGQLKLSELETPTTVASSTHKVNVKAAAPRSRRRSVRRVAGKTAAEHVVDWLRVHRAGRRYEIVNYLKTLGYSPLGAGQSVDSTCRALARAGKLTRTRGHVTVTPTF